MSLSWYFHRLNAMSREEILHRLSEAYLKKSLKHHQGWEAFQDLKSCRFDLDFPQVEILPLGLEGRNLMAGNFTALGQSWPKLDMKNWADPDIWNLDPVTGKYWPGSEMFCFDIPYRHEKTLGDIKYVWELNRLQFLQVIAVEYCVFRDPEALACIEAAIASWHENFPPFRGLGWNSGIEIALRAISLILVLSLVKETALSKNTYDKILEILSASAFWLKRFPSKYSSANNHKIAEDAALFMIALALPDMKDRAILLSSRRDDLAQELLKQIHEDGVPAEQSPSYGAFTAEFLLLCLRASKDQVTFPDEVLQRLGRFSDFIFAIHDPKGLNARIGDDDEGRVIYTGKAEPNYAYDIACQIRTIIGRPCAEPDPLRRAFFHSASYVIAPYVDSGKKYGIESFKTGGYSKLSALISGHDCELILDHGPLGYLAIAAHGHADALCVLLNIDGVPVFIDPGTFLYHSGRERRDWFRSTRAHNTLTLEDTDQSRMRGTFNWSDHAAARLVEGKQSPSGSLVTARHYGYRKSLGVDHERQIQTAQEHLLITDRLIRKKPTTSSDLHAELVFQSAPDIEISVVSDQECHVTLPNKTRFAMVFSQKGKVQISKGGESLDQGWISPSFGMLTPAARLSWSGSMKDYLDTKIVFLSGSGE